MRDFKNLLFVFSLLCSVHVSASNAELFYFDKQKLDVEFFQVNQLESLLLSHPENLENDMLLHPDFGDIYRNSMTTGSNGLFGMASFDFNFPAFMLGLCCCPVGLVTIVLDSDSPSDKKNSFWIGSMGFVMWSGCVSFIWLTSSISYYTY